VPYVDPPARLSRVSVDVLIADVADKGTEEPLPEAGLPLWGERSMTENALVQFSGSTASPPAVCEGEVVEDEQLAWADTDPNFNVLNAQASLFEERRLVAERGELRSAQEVGLLLETGKDGGTAERGFDDPRETALDVAGGVIRGPMAGPIDGKATQELFPVWPAAWGEQAPQRDQPRGCDGCRRISEDVQRREPGHVGDCHRNERHSEVEMQRLEIAAGRPVGRRDHEVADDLERRFACLILANERRCRPPGIFAPLVRAAVRKALIGKRAEVLRREHRQHDRQV
jgi:hypothetical protein